LRLWATANYCRAGIKSLRGTIPEAKFATGVNDTSRKFATGAGVNDTGGKLRNGICEIHT
jgi:hypothetical protein